MLDFFITSFAWVSAQVTLVTGWVNTMAGGNDFLAAAIFAALGAGLTYCSYIFTKGIPGFFRRRFVVSLTVDEDGQYSHTYNLMQKILQKKIGRFSSRGFFPTYTRFSFKGKQFRGLQLKPGLGDHWFFYGGRLFWYTIRDLESSGSEKQKKRISLFTFSMDYRVLEDFLSDHGEEVETGFIGVHTHNPSGHAQHITSARFPEMSELAINPEVRDYFMELAENFSANVAKANETKTNYRVVSTLHGEPGSGKTSLICSMARAMGASDVYLVNLENLKDGEALRTLIMSNGSYHGPSIFILEDMHSFGPILKEEYQPADLKLIESNVNLSSVLNVLNGVIPLHNTMIFMTTNYIERIDDALLRPSRCTSVIELPRIKPDVANKWISERVPGYKPVIDIPIRGCDLDQIVSGSGNDLEIVNRNIESVLANVKPKQEYVYEDTNKIDLG